MMNHCFDVAREFSNFKLLRYQYDSIMKRLVSRVGKIKRSEASRDFLDSALICAINRVSPNYRMISSGDASWKLIISIDSIETTIAEGNEENLENRRILHSHLVRDYRRDSVLKEIRSKRKSIFRQLKVLEREILNTSSHHLYEHQFCAICLKSD